MRVFLIRHPAPLIAPGICYGRLDIPLAPAADRRTAHLTSDPRPSRHGPARPGHPLRFPAAKGGPDARGHDEMEHRYRLLLSNRALRGVKRVWTSPALRCCGPATIIAEILTLPLTIDPRLQELDFGDWEGQSWDAINRTDLDRWAASPLTVAPPGGESGAALIARVKDVHAALRQDGQDCIVVSHGGPLKLLHALLLGQPPDLFAPAPPIGSLTCVQVTPHPETQSEAPAPQHPSESTTPVPATG
jgi:broad specificity phosphatase PhoE